MAVVDYLGGQERREADTGDCLWIPYKQGTKIQQGFDG